jgi:hypothetical protein
MRLGDSSNAGFPSSASSRCNQVEIGKGYRQPGYYSTKMDLSSVASGAYRARFAATDELGQVKYSKVNKLLMTK